MKLVGELVFQCTPLLPQLTVLTPPWSYSPWGHVRGAWLEGGSQSGTGEALWPLRVAMQKYRTLCRALTVAARH